MSMRALMLERSRRSLQPRREAGAGKSSPELQLAMAHIPDWALEYRDARKRLPDLTAR